jgi:hypothetical protein
MGPDDNSGHAFTTGGWAHSIIADIYIILMDGPKRY